MVTRLVSMNIKDGTITQDGLNDAIPLPPMTQSTGNA